MKIEYDTRHARVEEDKDEDGELRCEEVKRYEKK